MLQVQTSQMTQPYEDLYKQHARMMYRTAYGITGSHEDAEDVLQNIFLALVRREAPPEFANSPEAYLHRSAVNHSINVIRSRQRQRLVDDERLLEAPYLSHSDDSMDRDVMNRRLYEAMAELKPEHAQILILRYMHDKTEPVIAKMFGVSRGTIAIKLFRSRMRLGKILRQRWGDTYEAF
jgi:RNA polymerase sigma-70 factor, ECF subfamily